MQCTQTIKQIPFKQSFFLNGELLKATNLEKKFYRENKKTCTFSKSVKTLKKKKKHAIKSGSSIQLKSIFKIGVMFSGLDLMNLSDDEQRF